MNELQEQIAWAIGITENLNAVIERVDNLLEFGEEIGVAQETLVSLRKSLDAASGITTIDWMLDKFNDDPVATLQRMHELEQILITLDPIVAVVENKKKI